MTRLSQSVVNLTALVEGADLATDQAVRELLEQTYQRRHLDLSDLSPNEQATLIAARAQELQPSPDALAARIRDAGGKGAGSSPSSASTPPAPRYTSATRYRC
jgi:tyrosyl-tRNA synthetase